MKENPKSGQYHQFVIRVPEAQGQFYVSAPGNIPREEIFHKLNSLYPSRTRPDHPYPINETVIFEKCDFAHPTEVFIQNGRKPGVSKGTKRRPDSELTPKELDRRNKSREQIQRRKMRRIGRDGKSKS